MILDKLQKLEKEMVDGSPLENECYIQFWSIDKKNNVHINQSLLVEFFAASGFRLMRFQGINDFCYVRINENIIDEVSPVDIKRFTLAYVRGLDTQDKEAIHECLLKGNNVYFSSGVLTTLPAFTEKFNRDTKTHSYFYYLNSFVEVCSEDIIIKQYSELKGCIWRKQIQPRQLPNLANDDIAGNFMFTQFLYNVCGRDDERFKCLASITGYLLHDYKEKAKAVILTDTDINDNAEGRTGKTLYGQALNYFRVLSEIDGKNFKVDDRFKYQSCGLNTQLVLLNDVRDKFNIEPLFTAITEGVTVEQKNKPTFLIRPKIFITSNKTVKVNGGSATDRVIEFEFANYYSVAKQPKDEFACWFFQDWNDDEWLLFDSLMLKFVQLYLKNGIIKPSIINLNRRKIIEQTSGNTEFIDFVEGLEKNMEHIKKEVYEKFKNEFSDFKATLTSNTFTKWLKLFATLSNMIYSDRTSNGQIFFSISGKVES